MTPKPKPEADRRSLGNTNALKHGFYSRRFRSADLQDLDTHDFSGLQDEIVMIRALSLAAIGLTRLIRTQRLFVSPSTPWVILPGSELFRFVFWNNSANFSALNQYRLGSRSTLLSHAASHGKRSPTICLSEERRFQVSHIIDSE